MAISPHKRPKLIRQRRALYSFGHYNPYRPSTEELPLVEENLKRLDTGEISLRNFLRQTPIFPRWREEHLQQARILLITNEPDLNGMENLHDAPLLKGSVESLAAGFHSAMLSWLSLVNHPALKTVHGEGDWVENGTWQQEHPRLAACGKAGYFLTPGEENRISGQKVLHMVLSPFTQDNYQDINPRNDQARKYHRENLETVERFSQLASHQEPRQIFIVGNRASIRHTGNNNYRLEAVRTLRKDKSCKISDLIGIIRAGSDALQVRICRRWPMQGQDPEVLSVERIAAFALRPAR